MRNALYKIAITQAFKVGPITTRNLVSYCGGVEAVFKASKNELLKIPGVGEKTVASLKDKTIFAKAEKELELVQKHGIQVFFYTDEGYPKRLRHYPDAPVLLFYKGTADLNHDRIVAMVGTRQPSPQGVAICEELVNELKAYDPIILSGLAYGIDITAHRKSVEQGIQTIGAMGHGFHSVYPPSHKKTAKQMLENGGMITEFLYDTKPEREHFPMRNRIIAGMCDALIVVETAEKGGSMITAQLANGYSKDVFAVPGRLKDKTSKGCNLLIKSHRAALIESAKDIGYVMGWNPLDKQQKAIQQKLFSELSILEKDVVDFLQKEEEPAIDQITRSVNSTSGEMAAVLLELEFKGIVKSLPGKKYMLV